MLLYFDDSVLVTCAKTAGLSCCSSCCAAAAGHDMKKKHIDSAAAAFETTVAALWRNNNVYSKTHFFLCDGYYEGYFVGRHDGVVSCYF